MMDPVFATIVLFVAGTTLPLGFDIVNSFLPPKARFGRLVAGWQRRALLFMAVTLDVC